MKDLRSFSCRNRSGRWNKAPCLLEPLPVPHCTREGIWTWEKLSQPHFSGVVTNSKLFLFALFPRAGILPQILILSPKPSFAVMWKFTLANKYIGELSTDRNPLRSYCYQDLQRTKDFLKQRIVSRVRLFEYSGKRKVLIAVLLSYVCLHTGGILLEWQYNSIGELDYLVFLGYLEWLLALCD